MSKEKNKGIDKQVISTDTFIIYTTFQNILGYISEITTPSHSLINLFLGWHFPPSVTDSIMLYCVIGQSIPHDSTFLKFSWQFSQTFFHMNIYSHFFHEHPPGTPKGLAFCHRALQGGWPCVESGYKSKHWSPSISDPSLAIPQGPQSSGSGLCRELRHQELSVGWEVLGP